MLNIGLAGAKNSGKDTAAAHLVWRYGYTRLAFADRLKGAALALNPYVDVEDGKPIRLASLVRRYGWEYAKEYVNSAGEREVRNVLQRLGDEAGRQVHGERIWIDPVLEQIRATDGPVVVSDVRYPNEIDELRQMGFVILQVVRPAAGELNDVSRHVSERDLRSRCDGVLWNDGTIEDLHDRLDDVLSTWGSRVSV